MNKYVLICFFLFVTFLFKISHSTGQQRIKDSTEMSPQYWALWNPQVQSLIDSNINKYRKADAVLTIKDVPSGTVVHVEQLSHDFYFGANIFNFNQLGTSEQNMKYKNLFGTLFNSATIPFYWREFEMIPNQLRFKEEYWDTENFWNNVDSPKSQPHWRRPATDPIVAYLTGKDVRIKGHTMIWGSTVHQRPDWLFDQLCPRREKEAINKLGGLKAFGKLPPEQMEAIAPKFARVLKSQFNKRVVELSGYYGGKIQNWDVVNESVRDYHGKIVTGNSYYDHSIYEVMPGDYAYNAFKTADTHLPKNVKININDNVGVYGNVMVYVNQIKDLLAHGCRIDVLGSQMHLFKPQQCLDIAAGELIETPAKIWKQMDTLSKAGIPIAVSEITIPAPGDDFRSRAIQAEIARNLYRLWFSIKSIEEITWWNVVDDCGAPGQTTTSGLFTRNMEPKPSFFALNKLINEEWKTQSDLKISQKGIARFRGFKGTYLVSWKNKCDELQQIKFHLGKDGDGIEVPAK